MSKKITANDLKTKGVSAIDEMSSSEDGEVIITVRGKSKYVVLPIEEYAKLRDFELESAIRETIEDIKNGRIIEESIEDHIKRITGV